MRIAHISSEVAPWSQTGGLGDVVGAIPGALEKVGGGNVQSAVFSPLYRGVWDKVRARGETLQDTGVVVTVPLAGWELKVRAFALHRPGGSPVYFLDYPGFYDRAGLYADGSDRDYDDNHLRFALLCRAAIEASPRLMGGVPDVFHAHDWQGGLVPVYLRTRYRQVRPACVLTIHNLAYQGVFSKEVLPALGLDWSVFTMQRMEYHDHLGLLKGGIAYADAVTTVSPSYAREIRTPGFGHGLDSFLRDHARNLIGILNGIDTESWNPATDPEIAGHYDASSFDTTDGKRMCRRRIAEEFGLRVGNRELLLAVVSRFAGQKGLDLVADIAPELYWLGAKLIVLGSGDSGLEDRFRYLGRTFSQNVAVRIGFDVAQSRRIYAGADAILIPSRFEPCGLCQMYAMRYGTVPIVHAVGGLRDTVRDPGDGALCRGEGTGFRFEHPTAIGLRWAISRASRIFRNRPDGWHNIMRAGMTRNCSWDQSARTYLKLYHYLLHR